MVMPARHDPPFAPAAPTRWGRPAVLALVALALALQICLLMSPESVWSMGTGILRGARRGFLVLPGSGVVGSWDSLGLFIVIFAGALAVAAGGSVRAVLAMTGMLGLAVANDVGSVAASWCLVALSTTLIQERPLRWRWASGTSSVLLVGVGLCALATRGARTPLHMPAGYGGVLDGDGIGLIRHILSGTAGWVPDLVALPPLLLLAAGICLVSGASPGLAPVGAAATTLLLLKLYPLLELAMRESGMAVPMLLSAGTLLVVAAGVRRRSSPLMEGWIAIGGAIAFLACRLPVEAAVWTVAWGCLSALPAGGCLIPRALGAVASALLLAGCGAGDPTGLRSIACCAMAAGATLAVASRIRRGGARRGAFPGLLLVLVLGTLVVPGFWLAWSGKLRYGVPGSLRAWGLLAGGIGAGVVLWLAARSSLDRFRGRVDAVGGLIRDTAVAWTSPSVDTAAVLWVAVERFGWQGMTLWLPRRLLAVHAMGIAWFQDVVVPSLGRIPLHALLLARWCGDRLASSPGMLVAVIAAVLALAWLR